MTQQMQQIVLASRPDGSPTTENFRLETLPVAPPGKDEVLVRVRFLSLDPYMRGRMNDVKSYAPPVAIDQRMEGGGVGQVIASNSDRFAPNDWVFGMFGWADHGCLPADQLRRVDPAFAPPETALGVLGMPGFTGWQGLTEFGKPKAGETLVVAAATGPVGSMVGQLAKLHGLRAVGIAGGPEKCRLAVEQFGFDACLDHRAYPDAESLRNALSAETPNGIDIYFENVGGKVLEAVLPLINTFGRIPVCGTIAWYDGASLDGPNLLPNVWRSVLVKRLSIRGFIIFDHNENYSRFLHEVGPGVASGEIRYLQDVAEGLAAAPEAFMRMLKGGNTGKQLVRLS